MISRHKTQLFACLFLILSSFIANAIEVPLEDFSLAPYSQQVEVYLPIHQEQDNVPLLSMEYQQKQMETFYRHYYSSEANGLSPWSYAMVEAILNRVIMVEQSKLNEFSNDKLDSVHQHYGENFKKHDAQWLERIKANMNLNAFSPNGFDETRRAIIVQNTHARALPESAPDFYHFSLAGEGFPFDNLQYSSLYAGTPIYVLHLSEDNAWALVLTPHAFMAWIKTSDLAYVTPGFMQTWQKYAQKELRVITVKETSLTDSRTFYQLTAYFGSVFPLAFETDKITSLYVPIKGSDGYAKFKVIKVLKDAVHSLPMPFTVYNLREALKEMQNQPYGWGGAYFYNDCSSEMMRLFTAFGIWLPRNSAQQGSLQPSIDLRDKSMSERIQFLKAQSDPLLTLIYIGGHVMLYLGEKTQGDFAGEPMTYQNLWGLSPESREKRYVVGQSVFLPLLKTFPEQTDIQSQANKKLFSLVFLRKLETQRAPEMFVSQFF